MTSNEQTAAFEAELRKTIAYFRKEFHLTLGEVVGTMNVLAIQLTVEQLQGLDSLGDYVEANTSLEGLVPPPAPELILHHYAPCRCGWDGGQFGSDRQAIAMHRGYAPMCPVPTSRAVEDGGEPLPVYAACHECGWPGGPHATKALANMAHDEHKVFCGTNIKLASEVEPAPPPFAPPAAPALQPMYGKCAGCGWKGGTFPDAAAAASDHNSHRPTCQIPTSLWSLPPETREFIESGATLAEVAPLMPPYAACPKCRWPGGEFPTQKAAEDAHEEHEFFCTEETRFFSPPLPSSPAPEPAPMPWKYRDCPNCSWPGGDFMTKAEAMSSHRAHTYGAGKDCNRRTSSLEIKDEPPKA